MILASSTFSSVWSALGSTVVHFLWQGALIGLLAFVALSCLRARSSVARHAVASCALLLCLLSFVGTFVIVLTGPFDLAGGDARQVALAAGGQVAYLPLGLQPASLASWCWAVGVLCMAVRFALQCYGAQRLKFTAELEADSYWQRTFQTLKEELGVSQDVRLLRSALAQVPMVVGWFSPIVLVPTSAFTGLSPDQLRSLLAHELAHIRRHDHWLNAAQAVVEMVLFFHPAVWWISKQVRLEREYCCDDSSVRLTGDPRLLAEALASMETLRIHQPMSRTVLAANGGPLMKRIARILGARLDGRTSLTSWQLPVGFVLAGLLAFAGSAYATPTMVPDGDTTVQDDVRTEGRKVWAKLQAAVDAGKLTEAQAKEKFAAWRKSLGDKPDADKTDKVDKTDVRAQARKVMAELEAAVKAGRLTEAQAKEKFAAWKKSQARTQGADRPDMTPEARKVWAELEAAVKTGRITEAQAKERFAGWQKSNQRANPRKVWAELEAAVKAGRITEAQAKERFEAYRKSLSQKDQPREKLDPEAVIKRIQLAVETGRLTPEQGKARIEELKQRLAAQKENPEAVIEGIKEAARAGKISREEAAKRIEAYKKSLAEKEKKAREKADEKRRKLK